MRLRPKFWLASLVVALGPLAGLGWMLSAEMDASLRASARRAEQGLADRTVDAVRRELDGAVKVLTFLARDPGGLRGDALERAMDHYPIFRDFWLEDDRGRVRRALHRREPSIGLTAEARGRSRRGIEARGYDLGPAEFPASGGPALMAAVPVMEGGGLLAARLHLPVLDEALRGLDLGAGVRVFLTTVDGRVIAHSLSGSGPSSVAAPSADQSVDGVSMLGVAAEMSERGWRVVVQQPAATALAALRAARRRILGGLAGAALLAVLLAWILGRAVARPLGDFVRVARKMKAGEFDSLIDVRSRDEIGEIATHLREAQPILERRVRDAVLGTMARSLGHDLRQPVQALRGALDSVAAHVTGADATAERQFRLIDETLDWMDDFIEDMLTVGRERPLQRRRRTLDELLAPLCEKIHPPAGVDWIVEPAPGLTFWVDEREVRKALGNAVKNAFEALLERVASGAPGRVTVRAVPAPGGATLIVEDNGPGLPDEKLKRLFEEFTTKESGTGLGLLVIKKVMERHNGRVSVDSVAGQGVRIALFFPEENIKKPPR